MICKCFCSETARRALDTCGPDLVGPDGCPARLVTVRLSFNAPQANWLRSAEVTIDMGGQVAARFCLPDTRPLFLSTEAERGRVFLPAAIGTHGLKTSVCGARSGLCACKAVSGEIDVGGQLSNEPDHPFEKACCHEQGLSGRV